jgi:hypothetical protein
VTRITGNTWAVCACTYVCTCFVWRSDLQLAEKDGITGLMGCITKAVRPEEVWYMANIARLRAVLRDGTMRSAWTQPLAVV